MNKQDLQNSISICHANGRKAALSFCSHVPQEILEAAGFYFLRVPYIQDVNDASSKILVSNVCPIVKNVCDICEDPALSEADLILAETSCDGKKKMYELLSNQNRLYYYQVGQGADRDYVRPLIKSEVKFLIKEIKRRFDIDVTDEAIRKAAKLVNAERESIKNLMAIQKSIPAAAWGREIFQALETHLTLPSIEERIAANNAFREILLSRETPVKKSAARILITGCPMSSVYSTIIDAVENNGGVIVAFENCEALKPANRHFDTEKEDIYEAFADCYQKTACAIMSPNTIRFQLIEELVKDYQVDGVLDVTLHACHPYTVEKDKVMRLCREKIGVPYMAIETDAGNSNTGQLATRIAAFIEML